MFQDFSIGFRCHQNFRKRSGSQKTMEMGFRFGTKFYGSFTFFFNNQLFFPCRYFNPPTTVLFFKIYIPAVQYAKFGYNCVCVVRGVLPRFIGVVSLTGSPLLRTPYTVLPMVFRLDGCSFHVAHA